MIQVTTVKNQTKKQTPFPKIMQYSDGELYYFMTEFYCIPLTNNNGFVVSDEGTVGFSKVIGYVGFTDYNEPVTIQNV